MIRSMLGYLIRNKHCLLTFLVYFSAKVLVRGEPNVSYICSRYYRAPELIFGATDYTCQIGRFSPATTTDALETKFLIQKPSSKLLKQKRICVSEDLLRKSIW